MFRCNEDKNYFSLIVSTLSIANFPLNHKNELRLSKKFLFMDEFVYA